jgi:ribosomal protein S20
MRYKIQNNNWRLDSDTGFLTITVSLLNDQPMQYLASEVGASDDSTYLMSAPYDEMCKGMTSLYGMPVVVGHVWQTVDTVGQSVGNIKGNIQVDPKTKTITCDVLITDASTITRIIEGELVEISAAYYCDLSYIDDTTSGTQHNIDFNHLALLPKGEGRGGEAIRILNHKKPQEKHMATDANQDILTQIRLTNGKTVRVANEDADEVQEMDKKVENMIDDEAFQGKIEELKAARDQVSRLEGEMSALKEKLDAAMSPEVVEGAAAEMVENEEYAEKIMNSRGLTRDGVKRYGHDLKAHVVQQVRTQNGKPLADEQLNDQSFVAGMFSVYGSEQPARVAGAEVVNTQVQNSMSSKDKMVSSWFPAGGKS